MSAKTGTPVLLEEITGKLTKEYHDQGLIVGAVEAVEVRCK